MSRLTNKLALSWGRTNIGNKFDDSSVYSRRFPFRPLSLFTSPATGEEEIRFQITLRRIAFFSEINDGISTKDTHTHQRP